MREDGARYPERVGDVQRSMGGGTAERSERVTERASERSHTILGRPLTAEATSNLPAILWARWVVRLRTCRASS